MDQKAFFRTCFAPGTLEETDLGHGCWFFKGKLKPSLLPSKQQLDALWENKPKERESYEIWGKKIYVPRFLTLFSNGELTVRVTGSDFHATNLNTTKAKNSANTAAGVQYLESLLGKVNSNTGDSGKYNTVLSNWYPTGGDYIGWHGDREKQIDPAAPIMSISLGATRRFQLRADAKFGKRENKKAGKGDAEIETPLLVDTLVSDGDCVIMGGGDFQKRFKHRVPKMEAKKDGNVGERINLTVRKYRLIGEKVMPMKTAKKASGSAKPAMKSAMKVMKSAASMKKPAASAMKKK